MTPSPAASLRQLLLPFVPVYRAGLALREVCLRSGREPIRQLTWPVVSIGNLSTGGTGKTPLAIAIAQALIRRGVYVDVLSRGYGRSSAHGMRVDPAGTAEHFGDEPLLIAREARVPVYVAAERYDAGLLAEQVHSHVPTALGKSAEVSGHDFSRAVESTKNAGALAPEGNPRLHILDDGFQHRQLARSVDIVLLNRHDWGDFLLPAGNLREPVEALRRAHAIAIPAEERPLEITLRNHLSFTGPIWKLRRQMDVPPIAGPVVAFCGIARPEQFFTGLESAGLHVASRIAFRDHHRYIQHDIDCLLDAARSVKASALIATDKDLVRLGPLAASLTATLSLETAKLRIEIEDEPAAIDWLIARFAAPVS
jgi:tetraacyldisaccharide 4'-kinase